MKILHSSDWHLGRSLCGKRRHAEFAAFLDWLAVVLEEKAVDVLVVAGDVFDTGMPGNKSQELYYRFLNRVSALPHMQVVVTAGNHDSPSFLCAPKELLKSMNIHVVGAVSDDVSDELLVLDGPDGKPGLIVCAVPYLRDRDIRLSEAGESLEDKSRRLLDGIAEHYRKLADLANAKLQELELDIPVLATGHLFAAGGALEADDGVRELYVGSLAHVPASVFPPVFNYVALGHLHRAQKLGQMEHIRYSGSPLPMSFGESGRSKSVCLVEFVEEKPKIDLLPVPSFQALRRLEGDMPQISAEIKVLAVDSPKAWLEVIYTGTALVPDLRQELEELTKGTELEILKIKNLRASAGLLRSLDEAENLADLDVYDVFDRCLTALGVDEVQRPELDMAYREAVEEFFAQENNE